MLKNDMFDPNGYKESGLTALFSYYARSRNDEKGHNARSAWLNAHCGGLETIASGNRYIATLPHAYQMHVEGITILDLMMGKRMGITLCRMEINTDSMQESIGQLYTSVLQFAIKRNGVNIYLPKEGQKDTTPVSGKKYLCIHQDDPLHDHDSTDLLDFITVVASSRLHRAEQMPFDTGHSHLIDPKIVP